MSQRCPEERVWKTSRVIPRRLSALFAAAVAVLAVLLLSATGQAQAAQKPCSSYPAPGSVAPADTRLPGWLTARYSVLAQPRGPSDRLSAGQLGHSLTAADLVLSQARFMGDAAYGGRVFLIPAEHLLSFTLAPARCLPASERSLERELHAHLQSQYRHWALCVVVLDSNSASPSCAAANARPEALLYAAGTPGFGLVPDGVPDVTLSYLTAPARTLRVHDNFYLLDAPSVSAAPCALQWESPEQTVIRTFAGCDYDQQLATPLSQYRDYVQSTLSTLQGQVASLTQAIGAGDLASAESDWLTAHETWLDIGQDDGPYSAYGALGSALDGTAAGLPLGTSDPAFTGFHKVELDLFSDQNLASAGADTARLAQILDQIVATPLRSVLPDTPNGIANWILRPHEILEDAIRDTLSGDDDYGSATGVATVSADVTATREFLTVLAPVLTPPRPRPDRSRPGRADRAGRRVRRHPGRRPLGGHRGPQPAPARTDRR